MTLEETQGPLRPLQSWSCAELGRGFGARRSKVQVQVLPLLFTVTMSRASVSTPGPKACLTLVRAVALGCPSPNILPVQVLCRLLDLFFPLFKNQSWVFEAGKQVSSGTTCVGSLVSLRS